MRPCLQKEGAGRSREMAQGLRTAALLPVGLNSVSGTRVRQLTTVTPVLEVPMPLAFA